MTEGTIKEWMVNIKWEDDGVSWFTSWFTQAKDEEEALGKARLAFYEKTNLQVGPAVNTKHLTA